MKRRLWSALRIASCLSCALAASVASPPTAAVRNGTLRGRYLPAWDQDLFLGIPYAQPPIGQLRFKWPQPLNTSFSGVQDATQYGFSCYQYGTNFSLSEDCLTLNEQESPVMVWIYGGGLYNGSTADPQYDLSGIVRTSQNGGSPIVGVSINYRLGSSNAGLLDQRMALRWVQENIAAFGGDASRVTIWGESAGAQSIGYHLHSYDGRDDGLFRAAIMESGGPEGTSVQDLAYYASPVENLTRTTDCYTSKDQLSCLRSLSSKQLYAAQVSQTWNPLIDGDFLTGYPSQLQAAGKSIRVPLLIGANSDEGSSFSVHGLNSDSDVYNSLMSWRSYTLSPPYIRELLELYPNGPANEPPYFLKSPTVFPSFGLQWRRSAAIGGDMVIIAQRRRMCEVYTAAGMDVYSYRFDTPLWNAASTDGAKHFVNVVFSFQNISGQVGPLPQYQSYKDLSLDIGKAYINFVNSLDPDGANSSFPMWPKYDLRNSMNLVMNSNKSHVESDTWRKEGIAFINSIWRELLA